MWLFSRHYYCSPHPAHVEWKRFSALHIRQNSVENPCQIGPHPLQRRTRCHLRFACFVCIFVDGTIAHGIGICVLILPPIPALPSALLRFQFQLLLLGRLIGVNAAGNFHNIRFADSPGYGDFDL